jgi:hypothetical protein
MGSHSLSMSSGSSFLQALVNKLPVERRRDLHQQQKSLDVAVPHCRFAGNTLEFLLNLTRDAEAANRFAPESAALHL